MPTLEQILKDGPKYRLLQAQKAIFVDLISDWNEATVFPLNLRQRLNLEYPLTIPSDSIGSAASPTHKVLLELNDGLKIESVLLRHSDSRNTICVSSQVGCPLGCTFCATGAMGFKRNLKAKEIVNQVLFFARYLKKNNFGRVTNIVFMGMGEPFLNYDNVLEAIRILHDPKKFNLGMRHFSISTIGLLGKLPRLARDLPQVNLAISLHAPNDRLRFKLMPATKNFSLQKLLADVDKYIALTNRQVMFEYLLIDGINDSEEHAQELSPLMRRPLYFLNLIRYNNTGQYKSSRPANIKKFKSILEKNKIKFSQRYSFGGDIAAACGQLATERCA